MTGGLAAARANLRRAGPGDMALVLKWRNDPFIVSRSSSRKLVTEAEHERWFMRVISEPDCLFFIIELEGKPIGQVRLERETADQRDQCVMSIYLVESQTGKGHGPASIRNAQDAAWRAWPVERIVADVRDDNLPGQRAFAAAGFRREGAAAGIPFHQRFVAMRHA